MNHYKYLFLLAIVLFGACQPNEDLSSVEILTPSPVEVAELVIQGHVTEPFSYLSTTSNLLQIHNATVQLIYDDEVLDEVTTDNHGKYEFSSQIVPVEGAYLLATAPGFYPNIFKIDSLTTNFDFTYFPIYLLRESNEDFAGEVVTSTMPKVVIKGKLQPSNDMGAGVFYCTTSDNKLAGVYTSDATMDFIITTVADEPLNFYYRFFQCDTSEPITIGPFTDDSQVGMVYEQDQVSFDQWVEIQGTATDCIGESLDGYLLMHLNDQTMDGQSFFDGEILQFIFECQLGPTAEITLTAIDRNSNKYGTTTMTYISGQPLQPAIEICDENDTYLRFSINGGPEIDLEVFTTANILPDGRAIIKQIDERYTGTPRNTGIEIAGTTVNEDYSGYLVNYGGLTNIQFGIEDLSVHIDLNDGQFLEGTVSGTAVDPFEVPLGTVVGTFRAKIY